MIKELHLPHWYNSRWFGVEEPTAHGGFSNIYAMSGKHIAKIRKPHLELLERHPALEQVSPEMIRRLETKEYSFPMERLMRDFQMHSELYRAGLQVPKPEGVFNVHLEGIIERLLGRRKIIAPGIVSQRIYGVSGGSPEILSFFPENYDQFCQQIEKAMRLGFIPFGDAGGANTIFDPKERKLYLIDFELWERK